MNNNSPHTNDYAAVIYQGYAELVKHHRECELIGTEMQEAIEALNEAIETDAKWTALVRANKAAEKWREHQWPDLESTVNP